MNPDNKLGGNEGGICCTPACPPRERQPIPSIGKPYEAPCTSTCLCVPKMCSIFGGHDYNAPGPDPKACSPRKSKAINVNTLGAPIGVLQATIATKSSTPDVHPHRFATTIVAFMKVYTTPESQWTEETLDGLLKEGQVLLAKPADPEYNVDSPLHIYSPLEAKVKRWHKVDDVAFQVELGEKYYFSPPVGPEEGPPPDLTMDKFRVAMKKFFSKHRFCLIKVAGTYKMVWRSRGVYFVLDLYGRKPEDLETDKENGRAMLICLKALDNVIHLINNLSGIQPTDPFNLRELKVVKMTGTDGKTMSRDFGKREHQYQVISDEYAVLKADTHLLRNSPDPIRTRSALPVGVAALLAAKIDHPATWNERMIEKIICYGVNVCVCCWEQCVKAKEPIDIERFPNRLKIAQFKARYTLTPRKFTGIWKCVPNFKQTELEAALISSFDAGDNNLLVQIDQNIYAIFKKNNFFYLFDPYRHRIEGLPAPEGEDKKEVEVQKNATLRMFRSLEMLLKVFTQMLLETNRTTQFAVHTLKINNIEFSANEAIGAPEEPILNEDIDVKSLNETLCFEEDETKCKLDLGGDDEDEDDITSGIVQMEMPERSETEESEEELEEEEGGLEDLGEYESSSSGDGHRHGKGRRKKSKGRKRKDGDGGGKGKKKGGKGKGKKGKAKGEKTDKLKKDKNKRKSEKGKKGKKDKDKENKDKKKKDKDGSDKRKSEKDKRKSDKDKSDKEKAEQDRKDKEKADKDKADKDKEDKEKDKDKTDKDKDKDTDKDRNQEKRTISEMRHAETLRKGEDDGRKQVDSSRVGGDQDGRDGRDGKDDRGGRDGRDIRSRDDRSAYDSSCGDERRDGDDYPPLMCKPNSYPGYSCVAYDMAVVGSESGTYESIYKLLRAGFKCADRILTMTPWGNYVVFRGRACYDQIYFLFDGCTCNVNRFRHLDLNCGTAGLICFQNMHDIICYILDSQKIRSNLKKSRKRLVDEICRQYC